MCRIPASVSECHTGTVLEYSYRSVLAGGMLIALVVAATVLADTGSQAFVNEAVVLAAISEVQAAQDNCEVSYGDYTDEPDWHPWSWGENRAARPGRLELLFPDETLTSVLVECIVTDTAHNAWFEINLRYHLKAGRHATAINRQVRHDVANAVRWYFAESKERYGDSLISEPSDSIHREGYFDLLGVVSYSSNNLYSVGLFTDLREPATMNSENFLKTRNYDLSTGQQFFLDDLFIPESSWETRLIEEMVDQAQKTRGLSHDERAQWVESLGTPTPEQIRAQEFTLGANGLRLECSIYCYLDDSNGIAPILFWMTAFHDISYNRLYDYVNPDGPFRHIDYVKSLHESTAPPSTRICEDQYTAPSYQRPNEDVGVFIANGTSSPMRATEVSQILSDEGFRWITTLWNAVPVSETKIYYDMTYAMNAREVQAILFPCMVELLTPAPPGADWIPRAINSGEPTTIRLEDRNVVIILGSDTPAGW